MVITSLLLGSTSLLFSRLTLPTRTKPSLRKIWSARAVPAASRDNRGSRARGRRQVPFIGGPPRGRVVARRATPLHCLRPGVPVKEQLIGNAGRVTIVQTDEGRVGLAGPSPVNTR